MQKEMLKNIAYCGLNCHMCTLTTLLPDYGSKLQNEMKEGGWEYFGTSVFPEFNEFWKVLGEISTMKDTCPMCRGGCGDPDCQIRKCAQARDLEVCALCEDFPCSAITDFTTRYPFLMKTNLRLREIGMEAWLAEQAELVAQGTTFNTLAGTEKENDQI